MKNGLGYVFLPAGVATIFAGIGLLSRGGALGSVAIAVGVAAIAFAYVVMRRTGETQ